MPFSRAILSDTNSCAGLGDLEPSSPRGSQRTDIDLAESGRDGLVHFTADVRILAPVDQARGNNRLLFDVSNPRQSVATATFNGVPWPINPAELTVRLPHPDPAKAEHSFRTALTIAREQGTRGYELRAATSLPRLWCDQGRRAEAHDLLPQSTAHSPRVSTPPT